MEILKELSFDCWGCPRPSPPCDVSLPSAQGSEEFSSDNFLGVEVQPFYPILGELGEHRL